MKRWNDKPYHSLDYMLRERYGEKVYRVALNGGMSCPNRDGTLGKKGCIFCSQGGSGDFAANAALSITEQINTQIKSLSSKRPIHKYIAYFQAYTKDVYKRQVLISLKCSYYTTICLVLP